MAKRIKPEPLCPAHWADAVFMVNRGTYRAARAGEACSKCAARSIITLLPPDDEIYERGR